MGANTSIPSHHAPVLSVDKLKERFEVRPGTDEEYREYVSLAFYVTGRGLSDKAFYYKRTKAQDDLPISAKRRFWVLMPLPSSDDGTSDVETPSRPVCYLELLEREAFLHAAGSTDTRCQTIRALYLTSLFIPVGLRSKGYARATMQLLWEHFKPEAEKSPILFYGFSNTGVSYRPIADVYGPRQLLIPAFDEDDDGSSVGRLGAPSLGSSQPSSPYSNSAASSLNVSAIDLNAGLVGSLPSPAAPLSGVGPMWSSYSTEEREFSEELPRPIGRDEMLKVVDLDRETVKKEMDKLARERAEKVLDEQKEEVLTRVNSDPVPSSAPSKGSDPASPARSTVSLPTSSPSHRVLALSPPVATKFTLAPDREVLEWRRTRIEITMETRTGRAPTVWGAQLSNPDSPDWAFAIWALRPDRDYLHIMRLHAHTSAQVSKLLACAMDEARKWNFLGVCAWNVKEEWVRELGLEDALEDREYALPTATIMGMEKDWLEWEFNEAYAMGGGT